MQSPVSRSRPRHEANGAAASGSTFGGALANGSSLANNRGSLANGGGDLANGGGNIHAENGAIPQNMHIQCFGQQVELPASSALLSQSTNVLEVRVPIATDVEKLRARYELLFELRAELLVIRKPCLFSCSQFIEEVGLYARRAGLCDYYVSGPSSWFRCKHQLLCPDFAVSEKGSYMQATGGRTRRDLVDVDIIMTLNFEDNGKEAVESVKSKAQATGAAAFGVVVSTSTIFVAYYSSAGSLKQQELRKPRFIDVGAFAPRLKGLRLYPSHCVGELWGDGLHDPELLRTGMYTLWARLVEGIEAADDLEGCYEIINLIDGLNVFAGVHGNTPLLAALKRHRVKPCLDFIQYLIHAGADCDFQERRKLVCPHLYAAAHHSMKDVLELMPGECVHRGALSPEHLCRAETADLLEVFLLLGVQPNERYERCLPLNVALCRPNPLPLVRLLVDAGADPTLEDRDGCALLNAVHKQPHLGKDVLRVLAMACGPGKIDTKVRPNSSALGIACLEEKIGACQVLLECGASPEVHYLACGRDLKADLRMLFKLSDTPMPDCLK